MTARRFELHRDNDVIAEGVEFTDRTVAIRWLGDWHVTILHEGGLDSVKQVHNHDGHTKVIFFVDPPY